jgi:hypothetical protein
LREYKLSLCFLTPCLEAEILLLSQKSILGKFARNSAQFWHFNPKPNFPKNLPLFWDFHPESNFPKNLPQFWDFLRIQVLGIFILRFRYFEFTACDCRSLEFTIGPTNISSLLVVGTSVFLVPLTLHWKKAADIGSPS